MMQRSQAEINSKLQDFKIIHNTNVGRFQSLAFCLKDHIGNISQEKKNVGASYITFSKTTYFDNHIKLLLLFKKHALNETLFCNCSTEFDNSHKILTLFSEISTSINLREIQGFYMFCKFMSRLFHIQHIYLDFCWIIFIC